MMSSNPGAVTDESKIVFRFSSNRGFRSSNAFRLPMQFSISSLSDVRFTLALSTVPTLVEKGIAPRHIDLRPFVLCGEKVVVVPGRLVNVVV